MKYFTWNRYGGYECSSVGDKRFSAFYARLADGRSIEEHYQVDVKGYPTMAAGKGRAPVNRVSDLFGEYLKLWQQFFQINPTLLDELKELVGAHGNCFSDTFATTQINQARAIATILNQQITDTKKFHYHVDGAVAEHSVWVFGSNLSGIHGKGAALLARERYGALLGVSEGLMDCCYGIPTVDFIIPGAAKQRPLPLSQIQASVMTFLRVAAEGYHSRSKCNYFVTRIACQLAGYHDRDIAPMFKTATVNCSFAQQWMAYLE